MTQSSPLRFGLRKAALDPALLLAEIGWRWAFGAAALAACAYATGRVLHATQISEADQLALRSRIPVLIAEAVAHIAGDAWPRLVTAVAILVPCLVALRILVAAAGRGVVLGALLNKPAVSMRPLLGLSFLRATLALAGVLAWLGAAIIAGLAATRGETSSPVVFLLVFLSLSFLVSLLWSVLGWYLSLAPVFAVRDGSGSLNAVAEAARAVRQNRRAFSSVSSMIGLVHLCALAAATALGLMPLALWGTAPGAVVLALMSLVALGYFVVADYLYLARLAAYVRIIEGSEKPLEVSLQPSTFISQPEPQPAVEGVPGAEG